MNVKNVPKIDKKSLSITIFIKLKVSKVSQTTVALCNEDKNDK